MFKISSRLVHAFIAAVHVAACFEIGEPMTSILLAISHIILAMQFK
jgi:hypothetical protein